MAIPSNLLRRAKITAPAVGLRAHRTASLILAQIVLLESTPNGLRDQWLPNLEQPMFKWIASDTLLYALNSLGSRWLYRAPDHGDFGWD